MHRIIESRQIIVEILVDPVTYYRTFIENCADYEMGFHNAIVFGIAFLCEFQRDIRKILRADAIDAAW